MRYTHRLTISTFAFLVGLGASPVMAQSVTDTMSTQSTTAVTTPNAANGSTQASTAVATTPTTVTTPTTTNTSAQSSAAVTTPNAAPSSTMSQTDTLNTKAIDHAVDRDLGQEQRIETGLKDGQLTTGEASRLERGESRIDRMEATDLANKDEVTKADLARLYRAESEENHQISQLDSNKLTDPNGGVSQDRMEADVQRNINQQQRIDKGLSDGSLTNTEASSLEGGQAKVDRAESQVGRNGFISASEQQTVRGDENVQSHDIFADRHNDMTDNQVTDNNGGTNGHGMTHDRDHDQSGFNDKTDPFRNDQGQFRDRDQFGSSNQTDPFRKVSDNDHDRFDRDHDSQQGMNNNDRDHNDFDRDHVDHDRDHRQAMNGDNDHDHDDHQGMKDGRDRDFDHGNNHQLEAANTVSANDDAGMKDGSTNTNTSTTNGVSSQGSTAHTTLTGGSSTHGTVGSTTPTTTTHHHATIMHTSHVVTPAPHVVPHVSVPVAAHH